METMTVVTSVAYAAGTALRAIAPTQIPFQGRGLPAELLGARRRGLRSTTTEPDSLAGALTV